MSEYRCGVKWDQSLLSKLVIIWNAARSVDEVCEKMGMMYSSVMPQAYRLRQNGVKLKLFKARPIDFSMLRALAEKYPPKDPK